MNTRPIIEERKSAHISSLEAHNFSFVVACNDEQVLRHSLLRSPDLAAGGYQIVIKKGFSSAGMAYNEGIEEAQGDVVILLHQDIYLPAGWMGTLAREIDALTIQDENWGVLGIFGVTSDARRVGHVYSTGLGTVIGRPFLESHEVVSLDEVVLVLRRGSGLRFDGGMPGFHHYGTDICLEAYRMGMKAYAIHAFCVHNSNGIARLPAAFWKSYSYMRNKWRNQLPVRTNILEITRFRWPAVGYFLRTAWSSLKGRKTIGRRIDDPAVLYQNLISAGQVQQLL